VREDEGQADREGLAEFLSIWPTAAVDDPEKTAAAWAELSEADRREAKARASDFLAELKAAKRTHVPGAPSYLRGRRWRGLTRPGVRRGAAPSATSSTECPAWSKPWWALLFRFIETGRPVKMLLERAAGRQGWWAKPGDLDPAALERFTSYPAEGEAMARWRPWFEARGARLPTWKAAEKMWVFLPSHDPPGWSVADDDDRLTG
jgi:hypothetical protein